MRIYTLKEKLLGIILSNTRNSDVAHDSEHTFRVLKTAEKIARAEKADLEVVIPAALFHDFIVSAKNNPKSRSDTELSADFAKQVLSELKGYPAHKIDLVCRAILDCSFTNGTKPNFLESKVVKDADSLDTVGSLGVMRIFATAGQLQIPFYSLQDPFCSKRKPNPKLYAIDFIFTRSLKVCDNVYTNTARKMAQSRSKYIRSFLKQLQLELNQISRLR